MLLLLNHFSSGFKGFKKNWVLSLLLLLNHFLLFDSLVVFIFSHVLKMLLFQFHFQSVFSKYMRVLKYTGYPRTPPDLTPSWKLPLLSPFSLFLRKNKKEKCWRRKHWNLDVKIQYCWRLEHEKKEMLGLALYCLISATNVIYANFN